MVILPFTFIGIDTSKSGRAWSFFTSDLVYICINFPDILTHHLIPCLTLTKWCNIEKLKPDMKYS